MRLCLDTPRRVTVVAPHPDDETIGAFGLMTLLHRRGAAIRVIVVTDGGASHPGSVRWPRQRLARERQRETRRAMRLMDLASGRIEFLALPDGALPQTPGVAATIAAAVRRSRPDVIVGPVADDDHADHRVVAAAIAQARLPGARRLTYPVWPLGRQLRKSSQLRLAPAVRAAKRRAIMSYRTQTGRITDDPAGFRLTGQQVAAFSRPSERFVEARR